jgi:hypothetical protein
MASDRILRNNPFGRSFVRSMGGAGLGCLIVVLAGLPSGLSLLLLTPYGVLLIVSAIFAALLTAILARLWRRRLAALAVMACSAVLTIVLFAALPLYLIYSNWGHGVTGPMFG